MVRKRKWFIIDGDMKIPGKKKSGYLPEGYRKYKLIANQAVIRETPQERFEHWGYLVYSEITSKLICLALANGEKVSVN